MYLHLVETSVLNILLVHSFPKCFPGQSFERIWPTTEKNNLFVCLIQYINPNRIEIRRAELDSSFVYGFILSPHIHLWVHLSSAALWICRCTTVFGS